MGEMGEIVREFLVESYENLDRLEQDMVSLESEPGSKELLPSVFRTIHTIKGTSGFLTFNQLEKLAHRSENLLSELCDGVRGMDQETADVLLSMVDRICAIMRFVGEAGQKDDVGIDSVIAQIEAIQGRTESAAEPTAERTPHRAEETPAGVPFTANMPDEKDETSMDRPTEIPFITNVPDEKDQTSIDAGAPAAQTETKPKPAPAKPTQSAGAAIAAANSKKDTESADHPTSDHGRSTTESSIRVGVDLLDVLVHEVSELVLVHNQIVWQTNDISDMNLV